MMHDATGLPGIVVVSGLMAAGKSTVAQALAERLPRSVHLRGDLFRKIVVNGRVEMSPEPSVQALAQLELRYELACHAAEAYQAIGFTVIYQDVIIGPYLDRVMSRLRSSDPGLVFLSPSLDTLAERDRARRKTAYGESWTPASLGMALRETADIGLRLDNSDLTVSETVDAILARASEMRRGLS